MANNANSVGSYLATRTKYDALGRAVEVSNPTEIYGDGTPTGDDAAGYRWTKQAYDWKGRPTLTTFPAVAGQALGNTTELSYGGCGCAGGEVANYRDERGRRRKLYKDVPGRLVKVEEMNWLESQGIYSTTTYTYNARDQITQINQQGQLRTMKYDGHGRLWKRTTPEQGLTTYSYNADDTVQSMTDARGVTTSYVYNSRHLVTNINYTIPANSTVTPTSNVTFEYDAAGNRTARYNGVELRQYHYDQLSRLDHEDIYFPSLNDTWRRISYEYNGAGQLQRLTNPWGVQVSYAYDANGRASSVTGANYAGIGTYASNLRYRAFGGMKGLTYGNGKTLALNYDARVRLKTWDVAGVLRWNYRYDRFDENSHRVTYAQNIGSASSTAGMPNPDPSLDRSYDYDQVGRLRYAHTGVEARMHAFNQANDGGAYGPYSQHAYYDVWGNRTQRLGWGGANPSETATYDAHNQRTGLSYDLSGNFISDGQAYS
ncbi:MAG TPA: hypothetical protein VJ842_05620 [Pyrinomonadaceae bacterium]|nr:hypothetical protein [Pyrinomonadaceae bacterium]